MLASRKRHRPETGASAPPPTARRPGLFVFGLGCLLAGCLLCGDLHADPFDHVDIDGLILSNDVDWFASDLVVNDVADDDLLRTANIRRLWLTWDADSLYVGITYQDFGVDEALRVYVDLDRGLGTANLAALDTFAGNFQFQDGDLCEMVIGRPAEDAFPGTTPQIHLVTNATGTTADITEQVASAQQFNTGAAQEKNPFPFWLNAEFAVPWSAVYGPGGTVPAYGVLKAVAIAARASAQRNGIDSGPDNAGLDGGTESVVLSNLHASILDIDGDGQLDPSNASVSGNVTLPGDPGSTAIVAEAYIRNWAGGEIRSAIGRFAGAGGQRDYAVARLPAGTFEITVTAEGYLPATQTVTVAEGQQLTGIDFALERATSVSGTVGFASGPGAAGTIRFLDEGGAVLGSRSFPAAGGPFTFFAVDGGDYTLSAEATSYISSDTTITVTAGIDVTGLEIMLKRAAEVTGSITFEGPGSAGTIEVFDALTGQLAPGGAISFGSGGRTFSFFLIPGAYRLLIQADGYQPRQEEFTVSGSEPLPLGDLQLTAVRASQIVLTDADGNEIPNAVTTISIPDSNLYFYAKVRLEARDDDGRRDLFDLDGRLIQYALSARKLDDISPPRGQIVFAAAADTSPIETFDFNAGVANFLVRDDEIEIIRIYATPQNETAPLGRVVAVFKAPEPTVVVLTAARDTIRTDGQDFVAITAQLYDASGNESRIADIPVGFTVALTSTGSGLFEVPTVLTNADGQASAVLRATGAGTLDITCSVTIANRVLDVAAGTPDGPPTLQLTSIPGDASRWRISVTTGLAGLRDPVAVTAQLVDAFGNAVAEPGRQITFAASPATLGAFDPPAGTSNQNGRAVTSFLPAGRAGAVTLTGTSAAYPVTGADLELRDLLLITDPPYDQEPESNNTFPPTDLTALLVDNDADGLLLEVPFESNWAGLQIHVLFETKFDAAGAATDPFLQPVNYGHANRPDYALTFKYSANDYGDFRRWNSGSGGWEWWSLTQQTYMGDPPEGQNILGAWVQKSSAGLSMRIPWEPFGGPPDSLRLELYLTQDDGGVKRSAFDSAPSDATLDLDFDYEDPGPGDWDIALGPVTLSAWSQVYIVDTDFPPPPAVTGARTEPDQLAAGEMFRLTATVTDAGGGIGDVLADLTAMAGARLARMNDDGTGGDEAAGDGTYTLRSTVPLGSPGGELALIVSAYDATNESANADTAMVEVTASVEVIVSAEDAIGDDHGPNRQGVQRKYYTYPTNSVFVPGSFDLTSLRIYETVAAIGGEAVEMIAFEVGLSDFPDPNDPGTADWNPFYGELNTEKIDIMIDSAPGGATRGFPNRRIDFEPWDAWEYGIVMDGWYKAVIPSLGQNTPESWRENALRSDRNIIITGDPDLDVVIALVSKVALGNPTPEDIQNWDICVAMSSHDIGDDENDFGGIRWVNEERSEWNFGGGYFSDQDANVMDLLLVPGSGRNPGRPQEELLDYESAEALQRLADGQTPVAVEMTAFEDTGPPVIRIDSASADLVSRQPLLDAPLTFSADIRDDFLVDRALFRYRPSSFAGEGWSEEEGMGYIGGNLWTVDLLPEWLETNLVPSPIDGTRYLEFQIQAWDHLENTSSSQIVTMEVKPPSPCIGVTEPTLQQDISLLMVDGSGLRLPAELVSALDQIAETEPWTGEPLGVDSASVHFEICTPEPVIRSAAPVPAGRPLNVFRQLQLVRIDDDGGEDLLTGKLLRQVDVSLHYPQAWVPPGGNESRIGLYEYQERADRWVLIGGNVNKAGNVVTVKIDHLGLFGLFLSPEIDFDSNDVVSGVLISPNPFSPNGDGQYDETTISFYLNQEATVTVEIYNIEANRQKIITQNFPYAGDELSRTPRRIPGIVWDGTDQKGDPVPYGIYIIRLIVTYNPAGGTRTIRSNHSVAVIR